MNDLATLAETVEIIEAWRRIGCGRVEASRPCLGICQDRRARLVELDHLLAAVEFVDALEARASELADFVRLVAATRAKPGGEGATLAAMRGRAQALLASAGGQRERSAE